MLLKGMPCSCKVPVEKYPENAEWGPLFWTLLHGLADPAGNQTNILLQQDEVRAWVKLLVSLENTIPCDICRGHYHEYLTENSPTSLSTLTYSEFGVCVRTWLWTLHNRINEGNDKPIFPFESLATYKGTDLTRAWKALEPVILKAIKLSGLSLFPWKTFLGNVRTLQSFYS